MPDQTARHQKAKPATVIHLDEATSFSKYKIMTAPFFHTFMRARPFHGTISGTIRDLRDLVAHLFIVQTILRNLDADLILVRYFTTKILLVSAIVLWVFRKKLLFIIQNNMQLAHVGSRESFYFKLLCRLGFQFAFWETEDGLDELGIKYRAQQFVVLPLAVYPQLERSNDMSRVGPPRIGVIGRELPEKNTDKLLNFLVKWKESGELSAEIVLGSDDTEVMERWASKGVTTVQTGDYQDYLDVVSSVDVLLIYYDRAHYFYRSSGVIHEAAYVGTAVVCPDFPVFRYQVTQPARVGALYQDDEGILRALQSAIEIAKSAPENFEVWSKSRCPEEFGRRIDRFLVRSR